MARHFDGAGGGGDAYVRFTARGLTAFPWGTSAALVWFTGLSGTDPPTMICVGGDPGDYMEFYVHAISGITWFPGTWNGTANAGPGPTNLSAGKWWLIVVTKATGTVNPRSHVFDLAAGTWTHANFTGTLADSSGSGATEHTVGGFATYPNDVYGDMAAAACMANRVMSDSEVERLAAGNWWRVGWDLWNEWPSGRDNPAGITRDLSKNRQRENAHVGQSRAARPDPPGFRFSIANRRR